jgi:hypothetical protein
MAQADSDNSTSAPAAQKPKDSIYLPTDTTPEQLFRAIGKLRKDARDEIDRLIRFHRRAYCRDRPILTAGGPQANSALVIRAVWVVRRPTGTF